LWWHWALPVFLLLLFISLQQWLRWRQGEPFSYSEFREAVAQGRVASVFVSPTHIQGQFKTAHGDKGASFSTLRVDDPELLRVLSAQEVKVAGAPPELP